MTEFELHVVKAQWETPSEGPDEPRRRHLIDLAFRLAKLVQPTFDPARTRHEVSSKMEEDEEWGGVYSTRVYCIGDEERGARISEWSMNPQDGMTPIESSIEISVYGIPDGWTLALTGSFTPPMRGPSQPMSVEARVPAPAAGEIASLLKQEVGAAVDIS
jgi:hypothetical protein